MLCAHQFSPTPMTFSFFWTFWKTMSSSRFFIIRLKSCDWVLRNGLCSISRAGQPSPPSFSMAIMNAIWVRRENRWSLRSLNPSQSFLTAWYCPKGEGAEWLIYIQVPEASQCVCISYSHINSKLFQLEILVARTRGRVRSLSYPGLLKWNRF